MSVNEKMTAIADAIRDKTGGTEKLGLDAMASGVGDVYEAGKQKEWSDFWDDIQENGKRTGYSHAFYVGPTSSRSKVWTDVIFKPKYDLTVVGNATNMFYGCGFTNLKDILEKQGVRLDTSQCTNLQALFGECSNVTHIPEINAISVGDTNGLNTTFSYCQVLISIDKLILKDDGTQTFPNTFNQCVALKNIAIEGVIGTSIKFSTSPLTVESMKSIISALKNYTGTSNEGTYTLTLKDTCKTALQADTEIVELDGVSYTYFELITAKGWNLA